MTMGTRIVDTETGAIVAESHGVAWTDAADMAISNGRKRELAETLIARAKRNARVIADQERAQQGRRHEQGRTLQALADSLPFGTRVEFDDHGTPVGLVNVESASDVDDLNAWADVKRESYHQAKTVESETPTQAPNRFDAIALEAANA